MLRAGQQSRRAIDRVHHVVDGGAVLRLPVRGAEVLPLVRCGHLRARLRGAFLAQGYNQKVELGDELPHVLVLPQQRVNVALRRQLVDRFQVGGVLPNAVLYVLGDAQGSGVRRQRLNGPGPHLSCGGAGQIPAHAPPCSRRSAGSPAASLLVREFTSHGVCAAAPDCSLRRLRPSGFHHRRRGDLLHLSARPLGPCRHHAGLRDVGRASP
mmetsp:Transcript_114335/g.330293  ORF Transcript_114335/g.330293 Transcript_114335/m.330293 type:complete len:211 (+) Transcript_114335:287-919(+)